MARRMSPTYRKGFSLIELVIVVVIIGIIAAIAIPRMSRGTANAADSALAGNLSVLRNAVDLYQTEHNGAYPTVAGFAAQLTTYTDFSGTTSATKDAANGFVYGPYLRKVPTLPVGGSAEKGKSTVGATPADPATVTSGIAWYYTVSTGEVLANTGDSLDTAGKLHRSY